MERGVTGYVHRPWANTFACNPQLYLQPESVEELIDIIRKATAWNVNIVTTGATHSPSTITATSGWLVNLDKLNSIVKAENKGHYTDVTVEAGIRLKDLNEILAKMGLCLQNLGSISEQSVAGVISTGTHGSSFCHGLISQQIVSMDIVLENGKLETVLPKRSRNPDQADLFPAALLSLGTIGVIARATVRCVPAFNLESRMYAMSFDSLLDPKVWNRVFLDAEYHRIWWYPYSDKMVVWQAERTPKPAKPMPYSFYGTRLGRFFYEFLLWIAVRFRPDWTPWVERWLFKHQFDEFRTVYHVDRSDKQMNMDCLFKQFVNEWSLPLDNGPEVLHKLREEILNHHWYVHAPIELRASNTTVPPPDQKPFWLENSPASNLEAGPIYGNTVRPYLDPSPKLEYKPMGQITNSQLTLNLNATMYRPFRYDPPITDWYDFFEDTCSKYEGKPHWAKNFVKNPWTEGMRHHDIESKISFERAHRRWAGKNLFGGRDWLREKGFAFAVPGKN